jgi:uncharacterized protein (TIGR04141 family)
VKVDERFFAVTAGYGATAIDRNKLEMGFGLRVALNAIDPEKIKSVDLRKVDTTTRQKRVLTNHNSPLFEFDFDVDEDLLNLISGQPKDTTLANKLAGADSLVVTSNMKFEELGDKCKGLLETFAKSDYKSSFGFIDHVRIVKDKTLITELDSVLETALGSRSTNKLLLAYPEIESWNQIECFKVTYHRKQDTVDEIDLYSVYQFFDEYCFTDIDPKSVYIMGVDHNSELVTLRFNLYEYLVYEVEHNGKRYLLSLGKWFELAEDYIAQVDSDIASIDEIRTPDYLPSIRRGQTEGDYNINAAQVNPNLVCLDKQNFPISGYDKVEVCDLMSRDKHFICVKKYNASSTLSHLFAQGLVSSTLLNDHKPYRENVIKSCLPTWPTPYINVDNLDKQSVTFVFAIAKSGTDPLAIDLPFFSKVGLRQTYRAIERMGFKVKLYRIDIA